VQPNEPADELEVVGGGGAEDVGGGGAEGRGGGGGEEGDDGGEAAQGVEV